MRAGRSGHPAVLNDLPVLFPCLELQRLAPLPSSSWLSLLSCPWSPWLAGCQVASCPSGHRQLQPRLKAWFQPQFSVSSKPGSSCLLAASISPILSLPLTPAACRMPPCQTTPPAICNRDQAVPVPPHSLQCDLSPTSRVVLFRLSSIFVATLTVKQLPL